MTDFTVKKSAWASKTLWVAVADFIAIIASQLFASEEAAELVKEASVLLLPVLMFVLRFVTSEPIVKK